MRVLSILCGLSFSVMAGYLLALSLGGLPPQPGLSPLNWAMLALALLGAVLALWSRCEGWAPMLAGCGIFLACQLVAARFAGPNLGALMCLAAAGFALLPLMHTPSSYWRVAG